MPQSCLGLFDEQHPYLVLYGNFRWGERVWLKFFSLELMNWGDLYNKPIWYKQAWQHLALKSPNWLLLHAIISRTLQFLLQYECTAKQNSVHHLKKRSTFCYKRDREKKRDRETANRGLTTVQFLSGILLTMNSVRLWQWLPWPGVWRGCLASGELSAPTKTPQVFPN